MPRWTGSSRTRRLLPLLDEMCGGLFSAAFPIASSMRSSPTESGSSRLPIRNAVRITGWTDFERSAPRRASADPCVVPLRGARHPFPWGVGGASCDRGRLRLLPAGDPGEPLEVGLPGAARCGLALEQDLCLAQDECVGTARSSGLMANGELMAVEPTVDVPSPLLVDRPFEQSRLRVGEEGAEGVAKLASESGVAARVVVEFTTEQEVCGPEASRNEVRLLGLTPGLMKSSGSRLKPSASRVGGEVVHGSGPSP